MKLFQQERFFSRHADPQVRNNGEFLLELIDQLQASLSISQDWANASAIAGLTRYEQMKREIVLYALERKGGSKTEAAKWLGITRQGMWLALKTSDLKANVIPLIDNTHEKDNLASANNPVERVSVFKAVSG